MTICDRGPRDTNELLLILMEFEESTSFCERRREDNHTKPLFQNQRQNDRNRQPRWKISNETITTAAEVQ